MGLGVGPSGATPPPTPDFYPSIEGYAAAPPYGCDPVVRPGVAYFRSIILWEYPATGDSGISRPCYMGGDSFHKTGQAWDWRVTEGDSDDEAAVQAIFDWLFAPDRYGNSHVMLRRLGITQIIWRNPEKIWESGVPGDRLLGSDPDTWRDCGTCTGDHSTHVHFSFSDAGADQQTSFWTGRQFHDALIRRPTSDDQWVRGSGYGLYVFTSDPPVEINNTQLPLRGDFDANGYGDVFWYGPGAMNERYWRGSAFGYVDQSAINMGSSDWQPFVGDFNADRRDDVFWFDDDGPDEVFWGQANGSFVRADANRNREAPAEVAVGDFNCDGADDIFWYGQFGAPDKVWFGSYLGFQTPVDENVTGTDFDVYAGNFNWYCDDILFYRPGGGDDFVWFGRFDQTFDKSGPFPGSGGTLPSGRQVAIGDFDGDVWYDDLLLYGPGSASTDYVYWGSVFGPAVGPTTISITGSDFVVVTGDWEANGVTDFYLYDVDGGDDYEWIGNGARGFSTYLVEVLPSGDAVAQDFLG